MRVFQQGATTYTHWIACAAILLALVGNHKPKQTIFLVSEFFFHFIDNMSFVLSGHRPHPYFYIFAKIPFPFAFRYLLT